MKTPQPHRAFALAACAVFALATLARAGSVSSSQTAPAINDADLANYGAVSGTDKWWVVNEPARGQSFMTGPGALRLKAITYQTSTATVPTKNFTIRVGKLNGTTFTESYSETATQDANWNAGDYVTWTFDSPPILDGNTVYGVDVGFNSSNPAVSLSNNLLKIQTAGLIDWNKSYAVWIESGALKDDSDNPFAGITDDTTWNFTTAAGVSDGDGTTVNFQQLAPADGMVTVVATVTGTSTDKLFVDVKVTRN